MIAAAESPPAEPATRTILIVDDDRSVADTFARMLKLEGFEVATALSMPRPGSSWPTTSGRTPSSSTCGCRSPTACSSSAWSEPKPHLVEVPVAIVTGDYFLSDPIQQELKSLGASIRFKPLWLEDLIALAKTLVSA